jgi:lipopolysaccharide export system protein LptA
MRVRPVLTLLLLAAPAFAAEPVLERSFAWSADVLSSDFRSDTLDLSGNVRVTQGPMSIQAGSATASNFRSDNSRWTFQDEVRIRTAEADLQANTASAVFADGQIADARVEGAPAQFAQLGGDAGRQVRGRAGVIEYDFTKGIVKLTDQVWFSNGKDEFRGDVVIYNVRDERVQINPDGQGRVRGIIRPETNKSDKNDGAARNQGDAAEREQIAIESGA